jgi:hypothetical protein
MLYYNIGWPGQLGVRCGAPVGMKWFRSNIKTGSRLALLALALQFALSFGHFHAAAQAAPAVQSSLSYVLTAAGEPTQQPASDRDSDRKQGDPCAICAVIALANAVLFATPPLLQVPQATEFLYLTTDAEFTDLNSAYPAFQSRAPPSPDID